MSAGANPDRDRLAAEYVLGTLEGEERREAEHLEESDREFQMAVTQWRSRFAEIDQTASPQSASEALWQRIEADLSEQAQPRKVQNTTSALVAHGRDRWGIRVTSARPWRRFAGYTSSA
jgi:anti-sigma-K factor RskA